MLTRAAFRGRYPEFEGVADSLIDTCLADALNGISQAVFGARADEAQACLTAHLLAGGRPWGVAARLKEGNGATVYSRALDDLITIKAAGYGVT
jgi:uncharacterized protein DUF4054